MWYQWCAFFKISAFRLHLHSLRLLAIFLTFLDVHNTELLRIPQPPTDSQFINLLLIHIHWHLKRRFSLSTYMTSPWRESAHYPLYLSFQITHTFLSLFNRVFYFYFLTPWYSTVGLISYSQGEMTERQNK